MGAVQATARAKEERLRRAQERLAKQRSREGVSFLNDKAHDRDHLSTSPCPPISEACRRAPHCSAAEEHRSC
jgi:hypothetical protein